MPGAASVLCGGLRVGAPPMTTTAMSASTKRVILVALLLLVGLLAAIWIVKATAPPVVPRILDERGNNLVYQCPGDPRCTPQPTVAPH